MKSTERITDKVLEYIKQYGIAPGSGIVVAWSGGPDSTVLLHVLDNLKQFNFSLTAAWYNHRLRAPDNMDAEEALVDEAAEKNGIRLVKGAADPGAIAAESASESISLEEAARNARYAFLNRIAGESGAEYIAVGHNLNDNSETMLMRFLRNEGVSGLSGIPERRANIIRPLCRVDRRDIDQYILESGLQTSIDHTNYENNFIRNRMRNELLPEIRKVVPEADDNLRKLSSKIALYNDFTASEAARLRWEKSGDAMRIEAETFYDAHTLIRILSVFNTLNRMKIGGRLRFAAVEQAVSGSFPGNGKVLLKTSGFSISTRDGYIFIQRLVNHYKNSYFIYLRTGERAEASGMCFEITDCADEESDAEAAGLYLRETDALLIRSYRKVTQFSPASE